jgi:hypothetical protein
MPIHKRSIIFLKEHQHLTKGLKTSLRELQLRDTVLPETILCPLQVAAIAIQQNALL